MCLYGDVLNIDTNHLAEKSELFIWDVSFLLLFKGEAVFGHQSLKKKKKRKKRTQQSPLEYSISVSLG